MSSAFVGGVSGAVAEAQTAHDLPEGGVVAAGQARIGPVRGDLLTIEQQSSDAIINWRSFDIGAGHGVHFQQPNIHSATLNRVAGDTPSTLAGSLTATGSVLLVNPNGIGIAPGAIINTGSFAASTLDIADADFLSGTLRFRDNGAAGAVVNEGQIQVRAGGSVALIGSSVVNHGIIRAELGTVALAAGDAVTLDFGADGFLSVTASEDDIAQALGVTTSTVRQWARERANVALQNEVAQRAMLAAVHVPATMQARAVYADGSGHIVLDGGSGLVDQAGSISTQGGDVFIGGGLVSLAGDVEANGAHGGSIRVEGGNILSAAALDASGRNSAGGVTIDASGRYIATTGSSITANGPVGGAVSISADDGIFSSGAIEAIGARGAGGAVALGGADITLIGAHVNASGQGGGGEIRIGYQGDVRNPNINADSVDVAPSTSLRADALSHGDGGTIGLWSRENTNAFGEMSARGGAQDGDGGFIEASSRGDVFAGGAVDASAPRGAPGTFLIDPRTIVISDITGVFPQYQLVNPNASAGDSFGWSVVVLSGGNVVVAAPNNDFGDTNAGAVFLYNSVTGALISAAVGSDNEDNVGEDGIFALPTGNFVFRSLNWNNGGANNAGAVTFGSGVTGVSGALSAANSLVGSSGTDRAGIDGINVLSTGNYLVRTSTWNNGAVVDAGAVTFGSGLTGVSGAITSLNSLVGSSTDDQVGLAPITQLSNGNYVIATTTWNNGAAGDAGAVTWGSGSTGVSGSISTLNSIVGSRANDQVGSGGIVELANGNYVAISPNWDLDGSNTNVGAVTWRSGAGGAGAAVGAANSLVGSRDDDNVGSDGVIALTNGNYVVISTDWDLSDPIEDAGAVTWRSGTSGVGATVGAGNSLVGSRDNDSVGSAGVLALSNGNYVVSSPNWDNTASDTNAGAVTWGSGTTGRSGAVGAGNSLVGSNTSDAVGSAGVFEVGSGNYLVLSPNWDNGGTNSAGAATWGSGTLGRTGTISAANSLVGTTANDGVGASMVRLTNGNYVVISSQWNAVGAADAGAVTFGLGASGVAGAVGAGNSLVGASALDQLGSGGVTALTNGNYVVNSPLWNNGALADAGAATWGSGTTGRVGTISALNSLVGVESLHRISSDGTIALPNGNYLVRSSQWDSAGNTDSGAVTWGNGTAGTFGGVSAANSLVGSSNSDSTNQSITLLANGNYVVRSPFWNNGAVTNAGAVTWGSGTAGVSGVISAANSLVGSTQDDEVGSGLTILANGNYVVRTQLWNNGAIADAGAVTLSNGLGGTIGAINAGNSLVGGSTSDQIGIGGITALSNGNYIVSSSLWNNGGVADAGAVTFGNGLTGVTGLVSAGNSLVGSTLNDRVGLVNSITVLSDNSYLVSSAQWNNGGVNDAGAVSWGSAIDGVRGAVSAANSIVGTVANQALGSLTTAQNASADTFFVRSTGSSVGRVHVGLTNPNQMTFARAQDQTMTVRTAFLTNTLNLGTDVVLQANSDIVLNSALAINNPVANGGALSLIAGRSILLNADITTDNGNLTLLANAGTGAGVINAFRDPGTAAITMASGVDIFAGTGAVSITLGTGAGQTNNASGDITLRGISAGSVLAQNLAAGDIILASGAINATAGATPIILAAQSGDFTNLAGAGALNAGAGRFLVFSQSPLLSNVGGLVGQPWYATAYNLADPDGTVPSGNRFVYTLAPTLTITAQNTSRAYGDANPAFGFDVSGLIGGDTQLGAVQGLPGFSTLAVPNSPVGGYAITPSLGGLSSAYNYAFNFADGLLTVNTRAVTVTAADILRDYGDDNPALTILPPDIGGGDPLVGALTTDATATSLVGAYLINQGTLTTGNNPNYVISFVPGTLTVQRRLITVTANSYGRVYGDANPPLLFTHTDLGAGIAVQGLVETIADATTGVGAYAITQGTVDNVTNSNYDIDFVNGLLTIDRRPITVAANSYGRTYGDANPTLEFINSDLGAGAPVQGFVATVADAATDVGAYAITQGTVDNITNPNYDIAFTPGLLTIGRRAITVTADNKGRAYGDSNPALTFVNSDLGAGAPVAGSLATIATIGSDIGAYDITQGTVDDVTNTNYEITFNSGVLTIGKRAITVTADSHLRAYGDANPLLEFSTSDLGGGAPVEGFVETIADATTSVGGYAITQGSVIDANNPNYTITFVNGLLTIEKRPVTVTADNASRAYGVANPAFTFTNTSLGAGVPILGTPTTLADPSSPVGTYAISAGSITNANNPNYEISFIEGVLSVGKRAITVTADNLGRIYGDPNPALTYTTTDLGGGGPLSGDLSTAAVAGSNVGAYGIGQGTLTDANNPNYDITFVGGTLTISARAITVTAASLSRLYGDANPALTFTTSDLGAGAAVAGALDTSATAGSNVGGYAITQGAVTEANNPNYDISFVGGTLTINPRPIVVTAGDLSRIYGDANPALTFTTSSLGAGAALNGALATDAAANSDIGAYAIGQGTISEANNPNYDISFNGATLTITPRPIIVTAENASRAYGDANPQFAFTTSDLGGGAAINGALSSGADQSSAIGGFAIDAGTLTDANNPNYDITYVGGVLTVAPRPITITLDDLSKFFGQPDPSLTFAVTTGSLVNGDAFAGAPTRAAGETPGAYAITGGSLALSPNYTLSVINGALTISPAGVGDLSPVITGPNGEVAQNGATTTDLTGPSGIA
ncbi:MAG: MBG domain-containing protein, partial [Hyphomonadaceae bacterium]